MLQNIWKSSILQSDFKAKIAINILKTFMKLTRGVTSFCLFSFFSLKNRSEKVLAWLFCALWWCKMIFTPLLCKILQSCWYGLQIWGEEPSFTIFGKKVIGKWITASQVLEFSFFRTTKSCWLPDLSSRVHENRTLEQSQWSRIKKQLALMKQ